MLVCGIKAQFKYDKKKTLKKPHINKSINLLLWQENNVNCTFLSIIELENNLIFEILSEFFVGIFPEKVVSKANRPDYTVGHITDPQHIKLARKSVIFAHFGWIKFCMWCWLIDDTLLAYIFNRCDMPHGTGCHARTATNSPI